MSIAISITDVTKVYDKGFKAIDGVNLEIKMGEIFSILGPNGAGKSTLIKLIIGELKPTSGEIEVLGAKSSDFLASEARFKVSYVPQENLIWPNLTVYENMDIMASLYKISKGERKRKIVDLLREFNLYDKRKTLASKLSGGMKRKLTIAMGLLNDPKIFILDEPTTGLDPIARAELLSDLERLRAKKKTIILTTHIVEEAERLSNRVAIMDTGKILKVGNPNELKKEVCSEKILELLFEKIDETVSALLTNILVDRKYVQIGNKIIVKGDNTIGLVEEISSIKELSSKLLETSIRRPTLEDVFLFLTGKKLE
ncbi:MAG: ABC transporter ATP-binding protein [Candidatus Njordarchaeia archaeon]